MVKEAIEEDLAEGYREMDSRELRKLDEVFLLYGSFYVPVTLEIQKSFHSCLCMGDFFGLCN